MIFRNLQPERFAIKFLRRLDVVYGKPTKCFSIFEHGLPPSLGYVLQYSHALLNNLPSLLRDLVIASPKELDETEPVAEGIRHKRKLAPLVCGDGLLQPRSR